MRRRQRSPDHLWLRSGSPGVWALAMVFVVVGLGVWLHRPVLSCDRGSGTCVIGVTGPLASTARTISLQEIEGAEVAPEVAGDGEDRTSLVLQTLDGPVPFAAGWGITRGSAERIAERVNAFLREPTTRELRLAHPTATFASLLFVALGILIAGFGASRRTLELDRAANRFSIRYRRLFLPTRRQEGELNEVTGVLQWSQRGSGSSRSVLGLLDVRAAFHPALTGRLGSRRLQAAGREVCGFLGLGDGAVLDSAGLELGAGETLRLLRGADAHHQEAARLKAQLQEDPGDVDGFRRLAICLLRLERRSEAGAVLRHAHRHHLETGSREAANRLAAIITVLGI